MLGALQGESRTCISLGPLLTCGLGSGRATESSRTGAEHRCTIGGPSRAQQRESSCRWVWKDVGRDPECQVWVQALPVGAREILVFEQKIHVGTSTGRQRQV